MKKFVFTKLSAAGNDFILFDKKKNPDLALTSLEITKLCNRRNGIGADGILTIDKAKDYDFGLDYFNADGSSGFLCGNGARCSLLYSNVTGWSNGKNITFTQNGNSYSGSVLDSNLVKFNLNNPDGQKFGFKIKACGQLISASYINTGSPHVVINISDVLKDPSKPGSFYDDINDFPVFELGREIRYHRDFVPEGTNVNFIQVIDGVVWIRTYERGVENETLACGTGSVASALIAFKNFKLGNAIKLNVKNGDQLVVDFEAADQSFEKISLTGPAKIIFTGEITL
jgi:diaminopimelate epimerase